MPTRALFLLHRATGLAAALFLFVIGLSGAALVLKPDFDSVAVAPGTLEPIERILAAGGERPMGLMIPERADRAWTVYAARGARWVDPYRAEDRGPASGGVMETLRRVHVQLFWFGRSGRQAVGIAGLALVLSSVTGILIYGDFQRGVRAQGLRWWQLRSGGRLRLADAHKLTGWLTLLFHLMIGVTGAWLVFESSVARRMPTPSVKSARRDGPMIPGAQAMEIARKAMPGFAPAGLLLPSARSGHYTMYGGFGGLERRATSFVCVDAYTGEVLQAVRAPGDLVQPLHFGTSFGAWKWLWVVLGVAGAMLPVSGVLLWRLK